MSNFASPMHANRVCSEIIRVCLLKAKCLRNQQGYEPRSNSTKTAKIFQMLFHYATYFVDTSERYYPIYFVWTIICSIPLHKDKIMFYLKCGCDADNS